MIAVKSAGQLALRKQKHQDNFHTRVAKKSSPKRDSNVRHDTQVSKQAVICPSRRLGKPSETHEE